MTGPVGGSRALTSGPGPASRAPASQPPTGTAPGAGRIRTRLVALLTGAGLLIAAAPALAVPAAPRDAGGRGGHDTRPDDDEMAALSLLHGAARAGQDLSYTGTQLSATSRSSPQPGGGAGSVLVDVRHDPAHGATVEAEEPLAVTAALDPRQLALLAAAYDLRITGDGSCAGRPAQVVTALRTARTSTPGSLAGRFWLDRRSGLLLRREVFDAAGSRVRSSAFVDLDVARTVEAPARLDHDAALPQASTLASLRRDGWQVPTVLPGRFRLFDTSLSAPVAGRHVLHLAYSDGLSTVSLFAQEGALGTAPLTGYRRESVGARPVWVRHEGPVRVVWAGEGRVWTLLSDAPSASVREVVAALPRDDVPESAPAARLGRGLRRMGAMLNPF